MPVGWQNLPFELRTAVADAAHAVNGARLRLSDRQLYDADTVSRKFLQRFASEMDNLPPPPFNELWVATDNGAFYFIVTRDVAPGRFLIQHAGGRSIDVRPEILGMMLPRVRQIIRNPALGNLRIEVYSFGHMVVLPAPDFEPV